MGDQLHGAAGAGAGLAGDTGARTCHYCFPMILWPADKKRCKLSVNKLTGCITANFRGAFESDVHNNLVNIILCKKILLGSDTLNL